MYKRYSIFPSGPFTGENVSPLMMKLSSVAYLITISITSSCTLKSLTTPFLPTFSLPASNCGFIRQTISALSFRRLTAAGRTLVREMKDTSTEAKSAFSGKSSSVT